MRKFINIVHETLVSEAIQHDIFDPVVKFIKIIRESSAGDRDVGALADRMDDLVSGAVRDSHQGECRDVFRKHPSIH